MVPSRTNFAGNQQYHQGQFSRKFTETKVVPVKHLFQIFKIFLAAFGLRKVATHTLHDFASSRAARKALKNFISQYLSSEKKPDEDQ